MNFVTFLADIFSEVKADGTPGKPSFCRISLGLLLAFCVGWITAIVYWHKALPDMAGVIGLLTGYGALVYGGSKAISVWQNKQ